MKHAIVLFRIVAARRATSLAAVIACTLICGCGPRIERSELGDVQWEIPKIPGADQPIVVEPYSPLGAEETGPVAPADPVVNQPPVPTPAADGEENSTSEPAKDGTAAGDDTEAATPEPTEPSVDK